jgi:hypothetical protein
MEAGSVNAIIDARLASSAQTARLSLIVDKGQVHLRLGILCASFVANAGTFHSDLFLVDDDAAAADGLRAVIVLDNV